MRLYSGFPPANLIANPHKRFVGLYYYNAYWKTWDKILDVDGPWWIVQSEDGEPRHHRTQLWANRFADKPFDINAQ